MATRYIIRVSSDFLALLLRDGREVAQYTVSGGLPADALLDRIEYKRGNAEAFLYFTSASAPAPSGLDSEVSQALTPLFIWADMKLDVGASWTEKANGSADPDERARVELEELRKAGKLPPLAPAQPAPAKVVLAEPITPTKKEAKPEPVAPTADEEKKLADERAQLEAELAKAGVALPPEPEKRKPGRPKGS